MNFCRDVLHARLLVSNVFNLYGRLMISKSISLKKRRSYRASLQLLINVNYNKFTKSKNKTLI